jgi:hypothetical protein
MSEYVPVTLEAFAVLVYKNAYKKWNAEYQLDEDDETEASSLTSSSRGTHRFLYTGDSKGSRKFEGWKPEGMRFYNEVLVLIGRQRGLLGCTFERTRLKTLAGRPRGGPGNENANRAPRVSNNVNLLMQMVGV